MGERNNLDKLYLLLRRQKYHLVGRHSAVKRCNWLYQYLVNDRPCYKQRFYGIASHRCIQMTPTTTFCNLRCLYCWRVQPPDVGIRWNELSPEGWDPPETIIEGSIREQRRILSGYRDLVLRGKVDRERLEEALEPRHVAVSLAGEPTLYPYLGDLIEGYKRRGFTTFLVTNGTKPEALEGLASEPTQLYVTLPAPDEEVFRRVNRPLIEDAWEGLMETLELLSSFSCRTVIRLTLARRLNMLEPEKYAELIDDASPMFVEPKAYMHVGFSQMRLERRCMPTHREVAEFGEEIAKNSGYDVIDESRDSRVVLLSSRRGPQRILV